MPDKPNDFSRKAFLLSLVVALHGSTLVVRAATAASPAAGRAAAASRKTKDDAAVPLTCPAVHSGLTLRCADGQLFIAPGKCWVNDQPVAVQQEVALPVPAGGAGTVSAEPVKMSSDKLAGPASLVILSQCRASPSDAVPLSGVLVAPSVKVKSSPDSNAHVYKKGVDYTVDESWGGLAYIPGGAIKKDQLVYVDYMYWTRRLDTLTIDEQGKLDLVRGRPARTAPLPPPVPTGCLPLANIYVSSGERSPGSDGILPITTRDIPNLSLKQKQQNQKALSIVAAKLHAGEPVTIAFWGDSITGGADASSPDRSFTQVFLSRLKQKYPAAKVSSINAGIGGSNTKGRLPAFQAEVLSQDPDLVVVEFVNDLFLPKEVLESNYQLALSLCKQSGAEVILVAPHLPSPKLMATKDWKAVSRLPAIEVIRRHAGTAGVALADVTDRWDSLAREGLRPDVVLVDELIHPNDRGHEIYAEELIKCFD